MLEVVASGHIYPWKKRKSDTLNVQLSVVIQLLLSTVLRLALSTSGLPPAYVSDRVLHSTRGKVELNLPLFDSRDYL